MKVYVITVNKYGRKEAGRTVVGKYANPPLVFKTREEAEEFLENTLLKDLRFLEEERDKWDPQVEETTLPLKQLERQGGE